MVLPYIGTVLGVIHDGGRVASVGTPRENYDAHSNTSATAAAAAAAAAALRQL